MKHYLITGGAGFIGSHLIRQLLKTECRITCIDNFDPFYSPEIKNQNIKDFRNHPGFRLLQVDLGKTTEARLIEDIKEPIDIIIHLAAKAGVRQSIKNPLAYQETNIIGLQNLLDLAKEKKIKQFLFGSSSSVYGINIHFPWKEDEQLMPVSPYAMTKLAGEMLGHVYSQLFGIRFIALRFFTVYGPGQRPDLAIHKFTRALLTDQPITLYGDGNSSRDYTYVDDIIKGVIAAMFYNKTDFEIINLGNNHPLKLRMLISLLEEVTGKKAIIEKLPDQPGDVPITFAHIEKARDLLGYKPEMSIKEGLIKFVDWFIQHREILVS